MREARRLDCHDHEKFPRSRSTFAPLEKARRSNWVTDRPTLLLLPPRFYPTTTTALLSRPHSPPPAKLSSRISLRLVRISKRVHTRLFALFLPPSRAHDRQTGRNGEKKISRLLLHVSAEGVDATSLSLVVHGRKFKFRDGGENGEEPGSIRRERTLLYLSMRSDRSTPTTNSWDRSSVLERLHLDRSNRGSRHRDNS